MTAPSSILSPRRETFDRERSFVLGPAEGWSSVLLLAVMCALVGWAMDDARWVLGDQSLTDMLPWMGVLGLAWGILAAKLGRGRLVTHLGGAILATIVLSLAVGAQLAPGASPFELIRATSDSVMTAYLDLVVRGRATTTQVGHYILVLGAICWATGQFSGYAAYMHRRPLPAVVVPGAILFANVALTRLDQYPALVVFTVSALLFLVRFHVADEQRTWLRHRIGDAGDASRSYLQVGLLFVVVAVAGAQLLTTSASSAPLADFWGGIDQRLVDFGQQLVRWFPSGGPGTRLGGVSFGSQVTITGAWVTDDTPVVDVRVPAGAPRSKWLVAVYDAFDGTRWSQSDTSSIRVQPGAPPLAGTRDAPSADVRYVQASYTVEPLGGSPSQALLSGIPLGVDQVTTPTYVHRGSETFLGTVGLSHGGTYTVSVDQADASDPLNPLTLTANRLRIAGTSYPADLFQLYTAVQAGSVGPATKALATKIAADSGATNPYDLARAMEAYLRDSDNFTYNTDVTGIDCQGAGIVECFVVNRQGYCEHFASTMVMMLRLQGVPARLVEGFLPGDRSAADVETIRRNRAHAWVQVWFPGTGWFDFDPTGGGRGAPSAIPAGPVVAPASPTPEPSSKSGAVPSRRADPGGAVRPGSAGGSGSGSVATGMILSIVIPTGLILLILALVAFRRRLGRPVEPVVAYRTVSAVAGRLGYPRRPTQTVYEYIGTLSDVVPSVAPDLELVGRSTVEATYGHKRFPASRLVALGEARRRLRVALFRLIFARRRPRR